MGPVASLSRFLEAQDAGGSFERALAELRQGRKTTHWIWWVLPQLRGIGRSDTSWRYGLADLEEARAYARHGVLGPRLRDAVTALLDHAPTGPVAVLGDDAVKARSCLTLFARAVPDDPLFTRALEELFGGPDPVTLHLLEGSSGDGSSAGP